jgi:predicted ABC-type ATPase
VNADEIARGLSPFNPAGAEVASARSMLSRIRSLIASRESFAIETTCAGRGHAATISACRRLGYRITLLFLWLPGADLAVARVARRVAEGGHDVPEDVVRRRYAAGLTNMVNLYLPLADVAAIYDNSDRDQQLVARRDSGKDLLIHDSDRWRRLRSNRT